MPEEQACPLFTIALAMGKPEEVSKALSLWKAFMKMGPTAKRARLEHVISAESTYAVCIEDLCALWKDGECGLIQQKD